MSVTPMGVGVGIGKRLRQCTRHGADAFSLYTRRPEVVEALFPESLYPGESLQERAERLEAELRFAIPKLGQPVSGLLLDSLKLNPKTAHLPAHERWIEAAERIFNLSHSRAYKRHGEVLDYLGFAMDRIRRGLDVEPWTMHIRRAEGHSG